ncbi:type IX secretion system protein PorD [Tenacibaculum aestuarii]|uniref:type IX secretion system protein PorD n=1 Tax=Tenacibaculum aestuarii TaxID=362781 RepID=UPI003893A8C5
MRKLAFIVFLFSIVFSSHSQELNATVIINSDKVQSSNKQVYQTLQKALTEFINDKQWTNRNFKQQERINCAFNIIINEQNGSNFSGTLQVQSTRPVYNSTYATPVLNINDTNFNFRYNEFDPLIYNPTVYESNLISMIAFYAYTIIGVDADTFALKGGESYLKQAESIMLLAQSSGESGWQNEVGKQNRFALIDNLLSSKFSALRSIYYNYHRNGFDNLADNKNSAKEAIEKSVLDLDKLFNIAIGNYMIRVFLDAKGDEIVNVFSDGIPSKNQSQMLTVLNRIAPTYKSRWKNIK